MKIDLHVHSSERSGCAHSTEEEQIRTAISQGLDAIAFTDHFKFIPMERQAELNRKYAPFRIFRGIEVTLTGYQEDFLIFGVDDLSLEEKKWTYPDLHAFVRQNDGYMVMAHPFRYNPQVSPQILALQPDAIEVRTMNTPAAAEQGIIEVAAKHKIKMMWNSDAHVKEWLGSFFNVIDGKRRLPATDKDLPAFLRAATIRRGGVGV
jgi:histidinol phosphatase-like PHP family hydrolase